MTTIRNVVKLTNAGAAIDKLKQERDTSRELCGELLTHLKNAYQRPSCARDYLLESSITKAEKILGEKNEILNNN